MKGKLLRFLAAALLLAAFLFMTRLGEIFRERTTKNWLAFKLGRQLTYEQRRRSHLDDTFRALLEIKERTPPDAVILFPPRALLREGDVIPLAATASAAYSFIYPRVPVHWGDDAPYKDRVTHVFVHEHWPLAEFWPHVPRTETNRFGVIPWPGDREIP
jgi:hypothetical protein